MLENEFFNFIIERQNIWYKRFILRENPPWTQDKILQKYKIINVYRELDRCTLYILNRLNDVENREKLLLNIIFYRFFNRNGLYEELKIEPLEKIDSSLRDSLLNKFEQIKKEGKPIFNNAYLISSGIKGKKKHESVLNFISEINISKMVEELDESKTPEENFDVLKKIPMGGPFLACEIWTDLTYFNFFKQNWNDNDFVNIGPGAKWGLEIIFDKKLSKKEQKEKLKYLYEIQNKYLDNLPWKKIAYKKAYSKYPFLSITNIEGCLCEFRKYWNIKSGRGRRKYFRHNPSFQSSEKF